MPCTLCRAGSTPVEVKIAPIYNQLEKKIEAITMTVKFWNILSKVIADLVFAGPLPKKYTRRERKAIRTGQGKNFRKLRKKYKKSHKSNIDKCKTLILSK
jgi:hypothetical protein